MSGSPRRVPAVRHVVAFGDVADVRRLCEHPDVRDAYGVALGLADWVTVDPDSPRALYHVYELSSVDPLRLGAYAISFGLSDAARARIQQFDAGDFAPDPAPLVHDEAELVDAASGVYIPPVLHDDLFLDPEELPDRDAVDFTSLHVPEEQQLSPDLDGAGLPRGVDDLSVDGEASPDLHFDPSPSPDGEPLPDPQG